MRSPQTLLPEVEAEQWAVELDRFVTVRSKSAKPTDHELVRVGGGLAGSIRDLAAELRDARASRDSATTGILLETLGGLRRQALEVLSGRLPQR